MDGSARTHARYSGSNAHRFPKCPGQVALAATLPEMPESEYAKEGTKAHALLHYVISQNGKPPRGLYEPEMCDAVLDVVDYVDDLRSKFPDLAVFSEQFVIFPQSIVTPLDAAGYCDVLCISEKAKRAWAIDFKYGVGEVVSVIDNAQAKFYATAAAWNLKIESATLVIIQPRTFMDEWCTEHTVSMADLVEFSGEIEEAIEAAERSDAPRTPGYWCHHCPCLIVCPEAEKHALSTLEIDHVDSALPDPALLDIVRIGAIRLRSAYVRDWLKAVEDYAYHQARNGVYVPGAKLVLAQGRRSWDDKGRATAEKLWEISGYAMPIDELMCYQVVGITEAEQKVLKAVKPQGKEAVAQAKREMAFLTTRSSSGNLILVDESDKRPAYRGVAADFDGVTIDAVPEDPALIPPEDGRGLSAGLPRASSSPVALLAPPTAMWFGAQEAPTQSNEDGDSCCRHGIALHQDCYQCDEERFGPEERPDWSQIQRT